MIDLNILNSIKFNYIVLLKLLSYMYNILYCNYYIWNFQLPELGKMLGVRTDHLHIKNNYRKSIEISFHRDPILLFHIPDKRRPLMDRYKHEMWDNVFRDKPKLHNDRILLPKIINHDHNRKIGDYPWMQIYLPPFPILWWKYQDDELRNPLFSTYIWFFHNVHT